LQVAFQHLHVSQQVVREIHRLGALQVRVARNDHLRIFLTEADERALQRAKLFAERGHFVTQPHAHIERDLIVARAPRVELRAGGHATRQLRLDVHMNVLKLRLPLEPAAGDFLPDCLQPADDRFALGLREHADFLQHRRVRDRADDVLLPEPVVE